MAKISKEGYEAKERYAQKRMEENAKIETLTEEQHNVLSWLCKVRHIIHTNQKSFFVTESTISSEIYQYIDEEINYKLESCKLPKIQWSVDSFDLVTDFDYYELNEEERTTEAYNKLLEQCIDQLELINSDIEKYLKTIDNEHKTNYCPTGASRIE
jgi:hypothetical protein